MSPASESASAVAASDETLPDSGRLTEGTGGTHERRQSQDSNQTNDITQQIQTMIAAVRQLNDNAVQQGAAVAVSSAGAQLKNAVTGLGHLLAMADAQTLASGAASQIKQANEVVDAVEAGIVGTQAATEQLLRNMPAQQAQYAQETSQRFQVEMRNALDQVRGSLAAFQR
ncbi:hypothetical protein [Magnetospirillum sulfuroxidans]|uniref:Uncharacterized protein n=1 Tax=Magnetospirillum sulfuroxidans TaxID=611300 RepID=A0ABS5ID96_9PROT|nr:hypothetical protein [Magnetospirillum sulfuroxidans]MBR9972386.1 hypothetical protein [Magnetospirillum sulfuroxidans]